MIGGSRGQSFLKKNKHYENAARHPSRLPRSCLFMHMQTDSPPSVLNEAERIRGCDASMLMKMYSDNCCNYSVNGDDLDADLERLEWLMATLLAWRVRSSLHAEARSALPHTHTHTHTLLPLGSWHRPASSPQPPQRRRCQTDLMLYHSIIQWQWSRLEIIHPWSFIIRLCL